MGVTYLIEISGTHQYKHDDASQCIRDISISKSGRNKVPNAVVTIADIRGIAGNHKIGDRIDITINGSKEFEGYVHSLDLEWLGKKTFTFSCVGKTYDLYRYYTSSLGVYSGMTNIVAQDLIGDYITTPSPDSYSFKFSPSAGTSAKPNTGYFIDEFKTNGRSVGKCLEDLCDMDGYSFECSGSYVTYYQPSGIEWCFDDNDILDKTIQGFGYSGDEVKNNIRIVGGKGYNGNMTQNGTTIGTSNNYYTAYGLNSIYQAFQANDDYLYGISFYPSKFDYTMVSGLSISIYDAFFDQLSGSTITSGSVTNGFGRTLVGNNFATGYFGGGGGDSGVDFYVSSNNSAWVEVEFPTETHINEILSPVMNWYGNGTEGNVESRKVSVEVSISGGSYKHGKMFQSNLGNYSNNASEYAPIYAKVPINDLIKKIKFKVINSGSTNLVTSLIGMMGLGTKFKNTTSYPNYSQLISNQHKTFPSGGISGTSWMKVLSFDGLVPLTKEGYYIIEMQAMNHADYINSGSDSPVRFAPLDRNLPTSELWKESVRNAGVLNITPQSGMMAMKYYWGGDILYSTTGSTKPSQTTKHNDLSPYIYKNTNITSYSGARLIANRILSKYSTPKRFGSFTIDGRVGLKLSSKVSGSIEAIDVENETFEITSIKHTINAKEKRMKTQLSLNTPDRIGIDKIVSDVIREQKDGKQT